LAGIESSMPRIESELQKLINKVEERISASPFSQFG